MRAYRMGDVDGRFPVWSADGARRASGRWHERGAEVIYASRNYSTAMLEMLVNWPAHVPPNQHFVEVVIPAGTSYEVVTADVLPGWERPDLAASQRFGGDWYLERRSVLLFVPSVVARVESNVVINTRHPDYKGLEIEVGLETPVWWDQRLFA
ncbi:MAG: RES domain-containing protein [Holophagales bacterium]|nr:RES domain-containing protein [Holophagales bacterium]MYH26135.1 RES domain-containing protein [Holophagales bacterium]